MIYLASTYSHKDPAIMEERYLAAMDCAAFLLKKEEWVYSPIVHCHELAKRHELPKDFEFWMHYNRHMVVRADVLYVLCAEGWEKSIGVYEEMKLALAMDKPRYAIERVGDGYDVSTLMHKISELRKNRRVINRREVG